MSHRYSKLEMTTQEACMPVEQHKFILHRNNSADYVSLYYNGECVFVLPDEVYNKLLELLNNEGSGEGFGKPTHAELVECGLVLGARK